MASLCIGVMLCCRIDINAVSAAHSQDMAERWDLLPELCNVVLLQN